MAEMESSVSISITSAIVYVVSGLVFFLLVFLLVMMGVTNCNWDCEGGSVFVDVELNEGEMVFKKLFSFFFFKKRRNLDYIAPEMNIFLNSERCLLSVSFNLCGTLSKKIFNYTQHILHFHFSLSFLFLSDYVVAMFKRLMSIKYDMLQ